MEPAAPPAQAAAVPPAQPVPLQVNIPQGTAVTVRLIDPVDTEKHKEGDTFRASLDSPVVIEEKTGKRSDENSIIIELRLRAQSGEGGYFPYSQQGQEGVTGKAIFAAGRRRKEELCCIGYGWH
jgi:hypothetical protein